MTMTEDKARQLTICPCCDSEKMQGMVVCWDCWRGSSEMQGFKYWEGSLTDFIATVNYKE